MNKGIHVHFDVRASNLSPYHNLRPVAASHVDYLANKLRDGSLCADESPLLILVEDDTYMKYDEKTCLVNLDGYILNGNHRYKALRSLEWDSWEARVFKREELTIKDIISKTINADEGTFQILPEPWEGLLKRFRTVTEDAEYDER